MKAAIVTFIRAYSHGATMQAFALHQTLNELNIDNEMLDYYPEYFKNSYGLAYLGRLRYFPFRPIKNWLKYLPMVRRLRKRTKGFERFLQKNFRMSSKQFKTIEELDSANLDYDAFISGSDQVWHNFHAKFDPVFFLDFDAANRAKKWSYAASFGFHDVPQDLLSEYKRRLAGWDKYSVREKRGVELVQELVGENAIQCCDPTLLLDKTHWDTVKSPKKRRKPYVLVYYVNSSQRVLEEAKKLAERKNLEVVSITTPFFYEDIVGTESKAVGAKHLGSCAPDEFISLFDQAEYVITDSFHGTAFSLIYHRPFLTLCDMGYDKKNGRVIDLLDRLGIGDRQLLDDVFSIEKDIPWNEVDETLNDYKKQSIEYLKTFCEAKEE